MHKYNKSEILELVAMFTLFITLGTVWYYAWVKPNDEMRGKITQCMEEITEEEYIRCHNQVR